MRDNWLMLNFHPDNNGQNQIKNDKAQKHRQRRTSSRRKIQNKKLKEK